jgi:predicted secreted acid phosphatase
VNKQDAIIVDVDGTIAHNNGHRKPYDWSKVYDDAPIEGVIKFIQYIGPKCKDLQIIFVSGRMDECQDATRDWIEGHVGIYSRKEYKILMRKTGDYRSDVEVKEEIYHNQIEPFYNVIAVLDDRNKVVKMWRDIGLTCFQVADGDF